MADFNVIYRVWRARTRCFGGWTRRNARRAGLEVRAIGGRGGVASLENQNFRAAAALVGDGDSGVVKGEGMSIQLLDDALGSFGGAELNQETGGSAGPVAGILSEESVDGGDKGVKRRRGGDCLAHLFVLAACEDLGESIADCAQELGEPGLDFVEEGFFLARGIDGGEGDEDRSGGEVRRGDEVIGDGENDGTPDGLLGGLVAAGLTPGDADAGSEPAQGFGDLRREARDVVEGEDVVVAGENEELADARGEVEKRSDGG